jgi:hypothetical protein
LEKRAIASVLELLARSDIENARKALQELSSGVKDERERGMVMAAGGILTSMTKAREGAFQSWDEQKISRAARMIARNQMADDFDRGFAETLLEYAKMKKKE